MDPRFARDPAVIVAAEEESDIDELDSSISRLSRQMSADT